jgi:hypothetical protein
VRQRFVEISVKGELDAATLEELGDLTGIADRGVTRLRAVVRDDSALYGLFERLHANGLEVLAVHPWDASSPVGDLSPGEW